MEQRRKILKNQKAGKRAENWQNDLKWYWLDIAGVDR